MPLRGGPVPSPSAKNYGTKVSCLEGRKEALGQPGLVGRTTFTLRALSFPTLLLSRDFCHLCLSPLLHSAETVYMWQGRQLSVRPPLPEPSSLSTGVCRPVPGSRQPSASQPEPITVAKTGGSTASRAQVMSPGLWPGTGTAIPRTDKRPTATLVRKKNQKAPTNST